MDESKPVLTAGRQKISISKTLRKRGISEEEIIQLETRGLLKKYGICKSSEGRYIQYHWFRPEIENEKLKSLPIKACND